MHLITDREIEIGTPEAVNQEAAETEINVQVDGADVPYEYLSWFDGMLNLRLKEAVPDPETAKISVTISGKTETAEYAPFYTEERVLRNVFIPVRGNENSGLNDTYDYNYVLDYCQGGLYQILGQSDYTGLAAHENGMEIVVVGSDQSVYMAPEYRELYNADDAATRRTIPGTKEKPIIVTTADDVMRQDSTGDMMREKSDRFEMIHDFAQLFWEIGVTPGWENYPLSINDDPDTYNYVKHLEDAYAAAKSENSGPARL